MDRCKKKNRIKEPSKLFCLVPTVADVINLTHMDKLWKANYHCSANFMIHLIKFSFFANVKLTKKFTCFVKFKPVKEEVSIAVKHPLISM